jgi:hypothetical protein
VKFYNNLYAGAADASGYKAFRLNPGGPAVWDYNLYPASGMNWALVTNADLTSLIGTYTTQASVASAVAANGGISGLDGNSVPSSSPGFTGTGTLADAYKLSGGSPAKNTGKVGGVSGGATRDIGAWDGTQTQIGWDSTVAA